MLLRRIFFFVFLVHFCGKNSFEINIPDKNLSNGYCRH